jgi:SpoVK/Ycf46/Vps4 family AAA+-type ATPase
LVDAVEQWLAARGADDDEGEDAGPSLRLQRIAHELIRFAGLHVLLGQGDRVAALEDALLRGGLVTFFCGAGGTGKTLGAHAVAAALSRDLVHVDLSRIVSKYIDETEKSLEAVLVDAERAGAVLLLDEADALFGRHTEVRVAHDRYATVERDALLQHLQAHKGVVILECSALPAFAEGDRWAGLSEVVRFPRPQVTTR